MSGRRKGLDAERAAVREIRASGLRAARLARADRRGSDVDAVILFAPGLALEAQIRCGAQVTPAACERWARKFCGPGRVLIVRPPRRGWQVIEEPGAAPFQLDRWAAALADAGREVTRRLAGGGCLNLRWRGTAAEVTP